MADPSGSKTAGSTMDLSNLINCHDKEVMGGSWKNSISNSKDKDKDKDKDRVSWKEKVEKVKETITEKEKEKGLETEKRIEIEDAIIRATSATTRNAEKDISEWEEKKKYQS